MAHQGKVVGKRRWGERTSQHDTLPFFFFFLSEMAGEKCEHDSRLLLF